VWSSGSCFRLRKLEKHNSVSYINCQNETRIFLNF
jgi:hypothetical protein